MSNTRVISEPKAERWGVCRDGTGRRQFFQRCTACGEIVLRGQGRDVDSRLQPLCTRCEQGSRPVQRAWWRWR